ncbi:hypothetical protein [Amycolatopsis japonica]|uniref:hypothetical protein n=1 Tax=Amycolatopsis japonica TaxID=208439 RepID=UPI0038290502
MRRGRVETRPGGAPGGSDDDNPDDGPHDDRPGEDGLAAEPADHHDPDNSGDHADHDSPFHDDREATDDPAPQHSHPQTLTPLALSRG